MLEFEFDLVIGWGKELIGNGRSEKKCDLLIELRVVDQLVKEYSLIYIVVGRIVFDSWSLELIWLLGGETMDW